MTASGLRITGIETLLMQAAAPSRSAWGGGGKTSYQAGSRNWLFLLVHTDGGITGIGEGSGWPKVVETALHDLAPLLIGEDPTEIERLWQKMRVAMMGHGDSGVVGGGALSAIDMALWDISGKALGLPVWRLLGGRLRDSVPYYSHASSPEEAMELAALGVTAVKTGGVAAPVAKAEAIRKAIGPDIDLAVDLHGPPWMPLADAIDVARALQPLDLLFLEEPLAPEDLEGWRRLRDKADLPLAAGERVATLWGPEPLIAERLIDVVQPDTGRAGGLTQMRKLAASAEARFISVAPHSGSLGPVAEFAALHLLAAIPNALLLERMAPDWEGRASTILTQPEVVDGRVLVPDRPGLGVEIDIDFVRRNPSTRNVGIAKGGWIEGTEREHLYLQPRRARRRLLRP